MSRSPMWSPRLAVLIASAAIAFTACAGSSPTLAPSSAASAAPSVAPSVPASASAAAFTPEAYPATAVDCAKPPADYTGTLSQIKAIDELTVEFDLCSPDVAFLSKIAFNSNNIQDSDWLKAHAAD